MVMRAGLGVGVDGDGPCPQLLGTNSRKVDRGGSVHSWGLRRSGVEAVRRDHLHAGVAPSIRRGLGRGVMVMVVVCVR